MRAFWVALGASSAACVAGIAIVGWIATQLLAEPPAERLMTPAFELELAPGWSCDREGTEWVCVPSGSAPYPAIAIIAMKYRGVEDSYAAYEEHLNIPRTITFEDGSMLTSEVRHVRKRQVQHFLWVDGMHYQSELQGYLTHYMATITSHLGILVTFSAHRDHYERYKPNLDQMVASLVVYQK